LDTGLAAPSANPHKRISPTTALDVLSGLSGKIDAVLDDGPCTIGIESTIVDLTENRLRILRHGPITQKMIEALLQCSVDAPLAHEVPVPGNMQSHYQPYTTTRLMSLSEIETLLVEDHTQEKLFGVIYYSKWPLRHRYKNIQSIQLSKNKARYSKLIYQSLHVLDRINAQEILVEMPPQTTGWRDVRDRLSKATHKA
jgi:L-threonylcarbamoyladenylate synthase